MLTYKLCDDYLKKEFRKYLPEELLPKGSGYVVWKAKLVVLVKKAKRNGYGVNSIDKWIDRSIKATAEQILKEREA